MTTALFINGAFEATLAEIEKAQEAHPGRHYYLQPYASQRIKLLAQTALTPENPVTLYLSLTDSLSYVSYRAKIVGWQDKRELAKNVDAVVLLNEYIKASQPSGDLIYLSVDGKPCVRVSERITLTNRAGRSCSSSRRERHAA